MDTQDLLLDPKALKNLAQDLGLENTRKFMESLDNEFQKRIENLRQAIAEKSFDQLGLEAHSLKSSAQISGAHKLAEILIKIELLVKQEDEEAFSHAQEAITTADLTRFAFLDVKLEP